MLSTALLGVTRPPFLILTPVCVLLGFAAAAGGETGIDWPAATVAFVGAFFAHVSVNALNEYDDFRSGLDYLTKRTPFSGGSGTLVENPELAPAARHIGLGALAVTAAAGLFLLWRTGWLLLPIGLVGLGLVVFYTGPINRNRFLCLVAPGLGFGALMVVGSAYVAGGAFSAAAVVASLVPFFLVNNLLLLNQFPDVAADRAIGRDNLPVSAGLPASLRVYGLFAVLAYLSVILGWVAGVLPAPALLALATAPATLRVYRCVAHQLAADDNGPCEMVPCLGMNVAVTLATPGLLAAGIALAA